MSWAGSRWIDQGSMGSPQKLKPTDVPLWVVSLIRRPRAITVSDIFKSTPSPRWTDENGCVWTPLTVLSRQASLPMASDGYASSAAGSAMESALKEAIRLDPSSLHLQQDREISQQPLAWFLDVSLHQKEARPEEYQGWMFSVLDSVGTRKERPKVMREWGRSVALGNRKLANQKEAAAFSRLEIQREVVRMIILMGDKPLRDTTPSGRLMSVITEESLRWDFLAGLLDAWKEWVDYGQTMEPRVGVERPLPAWIVRPFAISSPIHPAAVRCMEHPPVFTALQRLIRSSIGTPAKGLGELGVQALGWLDETRGVPQKLLKKVLEKPWPALEGHPVLMGRLKAAHLEVALRRPKDEAAGPVLRNRL